MAETWKKLAFFDEILTNAANLGDNKLIRGDGGAKGVQESTVLVSDAGEMTNPSQPAFLIKPAGVQTNIAVGSFVTIVFDSEIFDIGNNFASNTFTAPITGKYQLSVKLRVVDMDTVATSYRFTVKTSNRTYTMTISPGFIYDPPFWAIVKSMLVDMDVNDTAYIQVRQIAGSVQTDIYADSHFSGVLIC